MDSRASPFTESKDPEVPGVRPCSREAFSLRTRPGEVSENSLPTPCRVPADARSLDSAGSSFGRSRFARDDRVVGEVETNGMRGNCCGRLAVALPGTPDGEARRRRSASAPRFPVRIPLRRRAGNQLPRGPSTREPPAKPDAHFAQDDRVVGEAETNGMRGNSRRRLAA